MNSINRLITQVHKTSSSYKTNAGASVTPLLEPYMPNSDNPDD